MVAVNRYYGTVRRISPDRTEIRVRLPNGGNVTCPNKGFEVGDKVCIIFDPSRKRVLKVIDKHLADFTVAVASSEVLQSSIQEPVPLECELEEVLETISIEARIKGVHDECADPGTIHRDPGPLFEEFPDRNHDQNPREDVIRNHQHGDIDWPY